MARGPGSGRLVWSGLTAVVLAGCGAEPILDCEDHMGVRVVCDLQSPEDLALLPGGERVLASEFGGMAGEEAGALSVIEVATGRIERLFPDDSAVDPLPGWGDADCPGPPPAGFGPHGIDLARRPDGLRPAEGSLQLLVVNHGGREAVEVFEVRTEPEVSLIWRGCVIAPDDAMLNDVVALPDGGFLTTRMLERTGAAGQLWILVKSMFGAPTGYVLEWKSGSGFRTLEGTEGQMPNGIEVSDDGESVYVNMYGASEIWKVSRGTGETLARVAVSSPDNSTWTADGRLLVAGHPSILATMGCAGVEEGACPAAFEIFEVTQDLSSAEVVFANEGAPMGAGTVALEVGDEIWIGTFRGDRLLRVRLGDR